jgi:23S rRNA (cytidine1920-2'-O)/16S rRNA (cytidine1409-2'-O)-methyltransferase
MRLDLFLYETGLCISRSEAKSFIVDGAVTVDGKTVKKPAFEVSQANLVAVDRSTKRYVSRGGLKLEAALNTFGVECEGALALDVGASSGGFTDCLLKHGAEKVYAVDVGHGQLAEELLSDARVINLEGINAKFLSPELIGRGGFPLAVSDVSFISQALIYAPVASMLCEGGKFISLIKPQFECGRKNLSSGGICKDKKVHLQVVAELFEKSKLSGLFPAAFTRSPITGGDGNTEYLALFVKGESGAGVSASEIKKCILGG